MPAWFIEDYDEIFIRVLRDDIEFLVPKFRGDLIVEEPYLYWFWNDRERGDGGNRRLFKINYEDVVDGYSGYLDNPSSAQQLADDINVMIRSAFSAGGDILLNKGDLLTNDGGGDVIHPAGADRSLVGYWSANSDGLRNWTPTEVFQNSSGVAVDGVTITGTGLSGDPLIGHQVGGANLWAYKAKTSATSGDPASTHLLWNNATQISATQLNLSHITDDGFDIDLYFPYIVTGDQLIVQDRDDSTNYQIWTVSGATTIHSNSYIEIPVTLDSSGGSGTTNFSNNHQLLVAKFGGTSPEYETYHIAAIATWNPLDGTTVHFNGTGNVVNTGAANLKNIILPACTIIEVDIIWTATSAAGSNESIPLSMRLNDTTDIAIATISNTAAIKRFQNTGLSQAMNGTTDYVCFKIACPTWGTNPTSVGMQGYIKYRLT